MTNLETLYNSKLTSPSDIHEHLPTLKKYTEQCEHVTEMGVRWVTATYAFMMGHPKTMVSIDIVSIEDSCTLFNVPNVTTESLYNIAEEEGIDYKFIVGDTRIIEIEPTDLLFIDTLHNYNQLKEELLLHSHKVKKYIILHDTTTFEHSGEIYDGTSVKGLGLAIKEFLEDNHEWKMLEKYINNNGLTILERV
jgi:hypothetical protein